jgi:hypothetical protein
VEAKKSIDERGFAGAVRSEQPNGATLQNSSESVKNRAATELDFESF